MVDSKKPQHISQDVNELEYKRRIFWIFFVFDNTGLIYGSKASAFNEKYACVNLPSDDFNYRYRSTAKHLDFTNDIISSNMCDVSDLSAFDDNVYFFIKNLMLHSRIIMFVKRRWSKKPKTQEVINLNFILLLQSIENLKLLTDKKYPYSSVYKNGIGPLPQNYRLLDPEREMHNFGYVSWQVYHSMKIALFQSELVRITGRIVHPERIKKAKIECIKAATIKSEMYQLNYSQNQLFFLSLNVPSIRIHCLSIFLNAIFADFNYLDRDAFSLFEKHVNLYRNYGGGLRKVKFIDRLLTRIYLYKKKSHENNILHPKLPILMERFSINSSDITPWIVPRYYDFFKFNCCLESNMPSIEAESYLDDPFPPKTTQNDFDIYNFYGINTEFSNKHPENPFHLPCINKIQSTSTSESHINSPPQNLNNYDRKNSRHQYFDKYKMAYPTQPNLHSYQRLYRPGYFNHASRSLNMNYMSPLYRSMNTHHQITKLSGSNNKSQNPGDRKMILRSVEKFLLKDTSNTIISRKFINYGAN
ncbi:hypothetical protein AYI68_g1529 [Smittium mucronatum]|uniref:Transcription factor domain-containing protein n=1 Tax=Smittium mucronatum TaxID=133383 RepID=A0A1R0H575_9FUNG|nr:hypothetical protein AYI68_g1529 [Smittium mucronatum]